MRRNSVLSFLKEKSFIIVLTLMLVSAGTMAALFSMGNRGQTEQSQTAKQEQEKQQTASADRESTKEQIPETVREKTVPKVTVKKTTTDTKEKESKDTSSAESASAAAELEDQYLEADALAQVSTEDVIAEGFSEAEPLVLQWPVQGEVLLEFAMDHSVYFPTLAQYQYNPAMIISAAEGTEVVCAAAGTVTDVGKTNEYGHYITMDLGNGYELTYGQLFDVTAEVGETLEAGQRIAMVAYPTRNYTEEGDNLYLKLTQSGTPIDPALFMETENPND